MMQRKKCHQLEWLEFELLRDCPKVKHAVFLRHGGHSQGSFASFNLGNHIGDQPENVKANLDMLQKQLKSESSSWHSLIWGQAKHGTSIALVNSRSLQEQVGFDGLITADLGITLMMKHADCQVALFYDPKNHTAANIHAGWRGSVANIYKEAVAFMSQAFGSNPSDILVCITPSLGPDAAEFIHYRSELPEEFWNFQVRPTYFDFWSISEFQLQACGILPHHIEIARLCTYSNADDFFSHRRDKISGRHATCITLL